MKKALALILVIVMALSLFAGCGNNSTPSGGNNGAQTSTPSNSDKTNTDDGKVYELIVSMHDSEAAYSSQALKEWGTEIEEASNGRIKFIWYFSGSIANAMESMDAVANGTCDICWSAPALFPGRFAATLVASLPMIGLPNNADGGEVVWNMYEKNETIQAEWKGMKVLALHANGAATILTTNKKIESAADFKDLRIRTTTNSVNAFLTTLGCAPTSFTVTDTFENLEKNIADGTIADWNITSSYRLYDVAKYQSDDNINVALGCILMNPDSYAKLPADLQAIIDEHSGVYASRFMSEFLGNVIADIKTECTENGMEIYNFPESVHDALEEAKQAGLNAWYDEVAASGVDGEAIYAAFLEELAAFESGD